MLLAFIQLLNSIKDQAKGAVWTLSKQFVFIQHIVNLLTHRFILDTKQVHLASAKIIHFANLLIRMRYVDILGSVITVVGNCINTTVWCFAFHYGIILVDELSIFFR